MSLPTLTITNGGWFWSTLVVLFNGAFVVAMWLAVVWGTLWCLRDYGLI
jgi:hypothetical protein